MNKIILFFAVAALAISCNSGKGIGGKTVELTNSVDSISYAIGLSMANNAKSTKASFGDDVQFNLDAIANGLFEGIDKKPRIEENQIPKIMGKFQQQLQALHQKNTAAGVQPNNEEGAGNLTAGTGKTIKLVNSVDSISYTIGLSMAGNINNSKKDFGDDVQFNYDAIGNGLMEGATGNSRIEEKDVQGVMAKFSKQLQDLDNAKKAKDGEKNIALGTTFLAENGKKEGVVTTPSGLQYKVVEAGSGASPLPTDKVKVHYHGTLIDGSVFDSSVDRGEPIAFSLQGVIKGWTEGIPTMKLGGKSQFYIPANLAYGPQGRPGIPSNSVLIFDVELLEINPAE